MLPFMTITGMTRPLTSSPLTTLKQFTIFQKTTPWCVLFPPLKSHKGIWQGSNDEKKALRSLARLGWQHNHTTLTFNEQRAS